MPEEESKQEEVPEEEPKEEVDMIDRANKASERLEAANKTNEALIIRQEKLAVQNALGGKSEAGSQPVKPKDLSPEEYSEKVLNGEVNPLE